jgi:Tfp pilus assembly protein PilX
MYKTTPPHPFRPPSPRRGFALIITIILMAFLVLLMVSFSALTRVEIQIAANYQQQDVARQNALTALNIALGQLQAAAGPDQRVTATADLAAADANGETFATTDTSLPTNMASASPTATNGLTTPKLGTRYWTGVWGNSNSALNSYTATPQPQLVNWLVSGNEATSVTTSTSGASFGSILAVGTTPTFDPSTVTGVDATTTATSTSIKFTSPTGLTRDGILLLGPGTLGSTASTRRKYDNTQTVALPAETGYVAAPLIDIKAPAGSVPALGSTATPTIGRYAYWVGDEGVKARVNLSDDPADLATTSYLNGYLADTTSTTGGAGRARFAAPARNAVELITGLSTKATANADNSTLTKVLQPAQLNFVGTTTPAITAATKARYHDLTTYSRGVLADTLRGGLRQDLTYVLANPLTGSFSSNSLLDESGVPSPAFGPTWKRVKSYWDLVPDVNAPTNALRTYGAYSTRIGSKDSVHLAPLIAKYRFAVTAGIVNTATAAAPVYQLRAYSGINCVIASPYINPLRTPATYAIQLKRAATSTGTLDLKVTINTTAGATVGTYTIPVFNNINGALDNYVCKRTTSDDIGGLAYTTGASTNDLGHSNTFVSQVYSTSATNVFAGSGGKIWPTDPYPPLTPAGGIYYQALSPYIPNPILTIPAPPTGTTYSIQMELVKTGNLAIDCLLYPTATPAQMTASNVLSGLKNCTLTGDFTAAGGIPKTLNWPKTGGFPALPLTAVGVCDWKPSNATSGVTPTGNAEVAGSYQLVLNAPANDPFYNEGAGVFYQLLADANMMAGIYTDAGNNGGTQPSAIFAYNGDSSPETTVQTTNLFQGKYALIDSSSSGWSLADWGRRTQYYSRCQSPTYTHLPFTAPDITTGDYPFYSLADLRNVNLSGDDESWTVGHQPTYIVGNSYHNVFVPRASVTNTMSNRVSGGTRKYYDMSYLLNTSLWDRYFFSSLPQSGASLTPVNRRLTVLPGTTPSSTELRSATTAANHLTIAGAFNINSTSPEAWRAVLGALNNVPHVGNTTDVNATASVMDNTSVVTSGVSFPRYRGEPTQRDTTSNLGKLRGLLLSQAYNTSLAGYDFIKDGVGGVQYPWDLTRVSPWTTHHRLTADELTQLSEDIAREVRKRGPFLSLAHFINRRLSADNLGRAGTLQAALDITRGTSASINSFATTTQAQTGIKTDQTIPFDGTGFYAEPLDTTDPTAAGTNHNANRLKGLPGWVMQGDILGQLGSVMAARSDTFVIRTYGDNKNPVTGAILGRAWCEAVVQRLPDYMKASLDSPETAPASLNDTTNKQFGRRFQVISFRWLGPNDI